MGLQLVRTARDTLGCVGRGRFTESWVLYLWFPQGPQYIGISKLSSIPPCVRLESAGHPDTDWSIVPRLVPLGDTPSMCMALESAALSLLLCFYTRIQCCFPPHVSASVLFASPCHPLSSSWLSCIQPS